MARSVNAVVNLARRSTAVEKRVERLLPKDSAGLVRNEETVLPPEGSQKPSRFLGFTHYCGKRRSDGSFIVWRKTATKRMGAKLRVIKAELIRRKHEPTAEVGEWLTKVVRGYYQYHAVPGNLSQISAFRHRLCRLWRGVLNHRSQRGERP